MPLETRTRTGVPCAAAGCGVRSRMNPVAVATIAAPIGRRCTAVLYLRSPVSFFVSSSDGYSAVSQSCPGPLDRHNRENRCAGSLIWNSAECDIMENAKQRRFYVEHEILRLWICC